MTASLASDTDLRTPPNLTILSREFISVQMMHLKWGNFLSLFFILVFTSCAAQNDFAPQRAPVGNIYFSGSNDESTHKIISADLVALRSMNFYDPNGTTVKAMALPDASSNSFVQWLEARVRIILDRSYLSPDEYQDKNIVAKNLGYVLYKKYQLKPEDGYIKIEIPGLPFSPVTVDSPRVGLIVLGAGFLRVCPKEFAIHSPVCTRLRLSTLFHEAKHSDDDGYTHIPCPKGHKFAGIKQAACDGAPGGPYDTEAHFLDSAINGCHECTENEKLALVLKRNEYFSRTVNRPNGIQPIPVLSNAFPTPLQTDSHSVTEQVPEEY